MSVMRRFWRSLHWAAQCAVVGIGAGGGSVLALVTADVAQHRPLASHHDLAIVFVAAALSVGCAYWAKGPQHPEAKP